jgi:hypothetical protein
MGISVILTCKKIGVLALSEESAIKVLDFKSATLCKSIADKDVGGDPNTHSAGCGTSLQSLPSESRIY